MSHFPRARPRLFAGLRSCFVLLFVLSLPVLASAQQQWETGRLYSVPYIGNLHDITDGGDVSGQSVSTFLAIGAADIAFSNDLSTMYVSENQIGEVLQVAPDGTFSVFASGFTGGDPGGLHVTPDRRIWLALLNSNTIVDITGGGNHQETPFPVVFSGLGESKIHGPAWWQELDYGAILVASFNSTIWRVDGDFVTVFGAYPGAEWYGLAQLDDSRVIGSNGYQVSVFKGGALLDISAGGDLSSAPLFGERLRRAGGDQRRAFARGRRAGASIRCHVRRRLLRGGAVRGHGRRKPAMGLCDR
jgi:hypothetical protein